MKKMKKRTKLSVVIVLLFCLTSLIEVWSQVGSVAVQIDSDTVTIDGNGVKVAIIDMHIYKGHTLFTSNLSEISYDARTISTAPVTYAQLPYHEIMLHTTPVDWITTNINDGDHGTRLAGIIAKTANGVEIVSIRIDYAGLPTNSAASQAARAIKWAVDIAKVNIINISFDLYLADGLNAACKYALNKGVVVTFASGNDDNSRVDDLGRLNPGFLVVGSADSSGERFEGDGSVDGSNYGPNLDILAPGVDIYSAVYDSADSGSETKETGTSYAAPYVAGVVALMMNARNEAGLSKLTVNDVHVILTNTAAGLGDKINNYVGYGLIDPQAAIREALTYEREIPISVIDTYCGASTSLDWSIITGSDVFTEVHTGKVIFSYEIEEPLELDNGEMQQGELTLVAGDSIIFKEYSYIPSGYTLTASIESNVDCANYGTQAKNFTKKNTDIENITIVEDASLTIYPNPNKGFFTIKSDNEITSYSIVDVLGKQVVFNNTNNSKEQNVDISRLPNGIYFIQLQTISGDIVNKKIIKK